VWTLDMAEVWLVVLALAHVAVGLGGRRTTRISPDLAMAALGIGVVLADVAASRILGGLPLALGWAATGLVFAGLVRLATPGMDRHAALTGLGGHLTLALGQALITPSGGGHEIALVVVAATSLVSGRLAEEGRTTLRVVLDAVALAVLAYVTAISLDGLALTLALAAETVGLIAIARRHREDVVAVWGAVAFVGATTLHALAVFAPPDALYYGLTHPVEAAAALALATLVVALMRIAAPQLGLWSVGGAAVLVLYAASVELVTPFADAPQQGQALLSGLWALTGVATLVVGLIRDKSALRHAALALLAVTATKVFLYDLASLTSLYRVASFIALGLLLLAGAFAWQRIRPQPLPDLRKMPGSLR
jgi:hypothetical protein